MQELYIQLIGFAAMFFIVLGFQKDNRKFILMSFLVASFLFFFHFILLGALTAALMNLIGGIRVIVFNLKEKHKWAQHNFWLYLFIAIFWIAGLLSWNGIISFFPVIAMTIESIALWNENTQYLRLLLMTIRPFWITYGISVGSIAGLSTETFILISLSIGIYRFDRKKIIRFFKKHIKSI